MTDALARLRDTPEMSPSSAQPDVPATAPHAEDLSTAALGSANPTTTSAPGEPRGAAIARALLGQTFSLALRNLARHRRRTALGVAAISCGVVALVLAGLTARACYGTLRRVAPASNTLRVVERPKNPAHCDRAFSTK